MRIVFFGTSDFASPALSALVKSPHKILAVVTQPDSRRGRRLVLSPPPTKVLARTKDIPVYQPQDASSRQSVDYLKTLGADLFVVVSFGQILKRDVLNAPRLFCVNLHASLLPRYRGAAPTNWAIINGDRISGVTVIRMNERMDAGDIILKEKVEIDPEDTNITLSEKLSETGADVLLNALDLIEKGRAVFTKQDDREASCAPKLKKSDGLIDWREPAVRIHDRVRGLLPWPGAFTRFDGGILKILKTRLIGSPDTGKAACGEILGIVKGEGIAVKTGTGSLLITHLQLEGRKALDADSFLRGHRLSIGQRIEE